MFSLSCSLPLLLKAKGRAAWDAVQANLLQTLQKLDLEAQVHLSMAGDEVNLEAACGAPGPTLVVSWQIAVLTSVAVDRMRFARPHALTAVTTLLHY
jgi:hypothetical protein